MNKELEFILNYILNLSNVPMKALKRTARMKIGMFGKSKNSIVNFDGQEIEIKVFNTPKNSNLAMEIFSRDDFQRNEFQILIHKTLEMEEFALFSERTERLFHVVVFPEKIRISTDNYVLEI